MTGPRPALCLWILFAAGCVEHLSPGPPGSFALISGVVEAPQAGAVNRRQVMATNLITHRVYRVRTNREGVFGSWVARGGPAAGELPEPPRQMGCEESDEAAAAWRPIRVP